jgi:hypothetical protein
MSNTNEVYKEALTKMFNSGLIKEDYPMIDEIIISDLDVDSGNISIKIKINDLTINWENMYDKGFDPHYLCDVNIPNLLGYLGLPSEKFKDNSFFVYNTDGEFIVGFLSRQTGQGGYYFPDENGKPYRKFKI